MGALGIRPGAPAVSTGAVEGAMQTILWKCEQYLAGQLKDRNIFESEEQAKAFAKKLQNVAPDLMTRIEPMPIQNVWN